MANNVGAVIGALIDRRDGDSGIKGAILGSLAERAVKVAVPLAIATGLAFYLRGKVRGFLGNANRPPEPSAL